MICKYCGQNVNDGEAFCVNCGGKVSYEAPATNVVNDVPPENFSENVNNPYEASAAENNNPYAAPAAETPFQVEGEPYTVPAAPEKDKFAIIALVCGILGMTCCAGSLVNIAGIVFGILSMKNAKERGTKSTMGLVGIILSAVGFVVGTVISVILSATGVFTEIFAGYYY